MQALRLAPNSALYVMEEGVWAWGGGGGGERERERCKDVMR